VDTIFKTLRVKATTVSVRLWIFSVCVNKYEHKATKIHEIFTTHQTSHEYHATKISLHLEVYIFSYEKDKTQLALKPNCINLFL
jgi:hypothetical protein